LNIVSGIIVSILLMMSLVLMMTTLFTSIIVTKLAILLGSLLVVSYIIGGVVIVKTRSRRVPISEESLKSRASWRMPSINLLSRPKWSRGRLVGMYLLRGYLVVAVIMLAVKGVQLGLHK
jgi:hypothetical protein